MIPREEIVPGIVLFMGRREHEVLDVQKDHRFESQRYGVAWVTLCQEGYQFETSSPSIGFVSRNADLVQTRDMKVAGESERLVKDDVWRCRRVVPEWAVRSLEGEEKKKAVTWMLEAGGGEPEWYECRHVEGPYPYEKTYVGWNRETEVGVRIDGETFVVAPISVRVGENPFRVMMTYSDPAIEPPYDDRSNNVVDMTADYERYSS